MNKIIDEKKLKQFSQMQKRPQITPQDLERFLMQQILNPVKLKRSLTSIVSENKLIGFDSDIKEGIIINNYGAMEEVREEIRHIQTLKDGTPVSKNGFNKCQTCGSIVSVDSIRRCPCGQTCCISKSCGCYSKKKDQWFCSRKHASLAMLGINLRWLK